MEAETDEPVEPQDIKRATKVGSVVSMLCRSEPQDLTAWLLGRFSLDNERFSFDNEMKIVDPDLSDSEICLSILKDLAGFESRSELKRNPEAVAKLEEIINEYRFE
ncbi:MAG: hypothetical protein NWE76_04500 [Candidatus Bathyarchaeota archaeon]|nr:hypothetical protein [Candidatus Bathyarchaeota archaeon]